MRRLIAALSVVTGLLLSMFSWVSPASADHYPAGGNGHCYGAHTAMPTELRAALSSPTVAKVTTYKDGTVKLTCVFNQVPREFDNYYDNLTFGSPSRAVRSDGGGLCYVEGANQDPFLPLAAVELLRTPGGVWKLTCIVPPR